MNVVLIGEESAGIQSLHLLRQTNHHLVAVLTSVSRSRSGADVSSAATRLGIPVWRAELVKDADLAPKLRAEKVDIILNVHSLYIIHNEILQAASVGVFNLHPGPLPRYAGLNAVSWAIYYGEKMHGVTLHKIVAEIDAGPIVYQSLFEIKEDDTALSVSSKCVKEGLILIERLLAVAAQDASLIPLTPQDLAQREYFGGRVPENGRLSWHSPAKKIMNFIRACDYFPFRSPWGYPITNLGDTEIGIVKAGLTGVRCYEVPGTVGDSKGSEVLVACADEWLSVIKLRVGAGYLPASRILQTGQRLGETRSSSKLERQSKEAVHFN